MKNAYRFNQETLQYDKIPHYATRQCLFVALSCTLVLLTITAFVPKEVTDTSPTGIESELIVVNVKRQFSPLALRSELQSLNFRHADIVYAQSVLETGSFTSTIFKENNNLFGMKAAALRTTTHKGLNRGHAIYDSWYDSVLDYAMYQSKYLSRLDRNAYFAYLAQNYAEDPNYVTQLKAIINGTKND